MGIFGSFLSLARFGAEAHFQTAKNELIFLMAKVRLVRGFVNLGFSEQEATKKAEEEFLRANIALSDALGLPEGGIVTIVETYVTSMKAAGGWPWRGSDQSFTYSTKEIIKGIENHRSATCVAGISDYPDDNIDDYVYYRMNLELPAAFHKSAADYGLDMETTKKLTAAAKSHISKMLG